MRYAKRRVMAALCALCLLCTAYAWAEEVEVAPVPYTQSAFTRTETGVTVTGDRAVVDLMWLRSVNGDAVGWLYQEETLLSQPVLQSITNEYYQKRGFDGYAVGPKGMTYLDAGGSSAMTESLVQIYGSGRDGGSLEGLNEYGHQEHYDAHPALRLFTAAGDYQADVFACIKTKERSRTLWMPGQPEESFEQWLARVCEGSEFQAQAECLPKAGERVLMITVNNEGTNRRLLFAALRPIQYETTREVNLHKAAIDRLPTDSGVRAVGPYGTKMVYAQNDNVWGMSRYESELTDKFRRFNGGGCGPTAAAIVVANLVAKEDLPRIASYSLNGLGTLFCSCSVNRVYCNHLHPPYQLETADEYLRYLPVIIADFAAGNNQWKINSRPPDSQGSNMRFLEPLCEVYGLTMTKVENIKDGLEMVKAGSNEGMLLCCALRGGPFTSTSHYVVVSAVDDEYFYVLDPLFRDWEEYEKNDIYHAVDAVLDRGVVRIKVADVRLAGLTTVGYITKGAAQ